MYEQVVKICTLPIAVSTIPHIASHSVLDVLLLFAFVPI